MAVIDWPYVQNRGTHWRYRRKVSLELREIVGKREIVIGLGTTMAEAVKRYPSAHAQAEALLSQKPLPVKTVEETPLELHRWALDYVRGLKLDRGNGEPYDLDEVDILRDSILDRYPVDEEDGNPLGATEKDSALVKVLALGNRVKAPEATLADAVRFYRTEKLKGVEDKDPKVQRIDRVVRTIVDTLDRGPAKDLPLSGLTRQDARDVRDRMLEKGAKGSTVRRDLNTVKAIITHAIKELPLADLTNPFAGLTVADSEHTGEDRLPFPDEALPCVRARLTGPRLLIWRLLEGTGCRLAEVTGLTVDDVRDLDGERPYLNIRPHPHRRLKNKASARRVPLIADALDAAKEALREAGDGPFVFPAYARPRGPDAASAVILDHVRAAGVTDPKITTHSLRHRLVDLMRAAGVPQVERQLVTGHANRAVSERYGGPEQRLEATTRALKKALG